MIAFLVKVLVVIRKVCFLDRHASYLDIQNKHINRFINEHILNCY